MSAGIVAPEAAAPPRRSSRTCAVDTATLVSQFDPGQLAMQAAYRYMQGAFDSPRLAAEDCGVDRQLVH